MKIFIDTANLKEIQSAVSLGVIDGVTTNPSLMAKEKADPISHLKEICKIIDGPISAEVLSLEAEAMVSEAKELAEIHKNIVIKIPMSAEGLKAVKTLTSMGIKTNVTLVFTALQALLAAKAGATYVSPFIGRLDDISHFGMQIIADIRLIFDNYRFDTEIISASIRNPLHVLESAKVGAHVATIPYSVIMQLIKHPLTDIGIEKFLNDAKKGSSK